MAGEFRETLKRADGGDIANGLVLAAFMALVGLPAAYAASQSDTASGIELSSRHTGFQHRVAAVSAPLSHSRHRGRHHDRRTHQASQKSQDGLPEALEFARRAMHTARAIKDAPEDFAFDVLDSFTDNSGNNRKRHR